MYGLDSIDWTKCIFDGMAAVYEPLIPYIVGIIASTIVYGVLKWFLHRVHDFFCFEMSAREQRKAHKRSMIPLTSFLLLPISFQT